MDVDSDDAVSLIGRGVDGFRRIHQAERGFEQEGRGGGPCHG